MSPVLWTRKSTFAGIFQGFIPGVCIPGLQEKKNLGGQGLKATLMIKGRGLRKRNT